MSNKNIAIFNSLPCHYEMFGYIIYYCKLNNYKLTIYTEGTYHMGWFSFYEKLFCNYVFYLSHHTNFQDGLKKNNYDLIFLTTDDDPMFDVKWMSLKVVCINHYYISRRIDWFHCIATRPFFKNSINWAIPCIPVFSSVTKLSYISNDIINVAIVGTGYVENPYSISLINRLTVGGDKKIVLHIITRKIYCDISGIDPSIEVNKYESISTEDIFLILLKCNYVLTDIHYIIKDHQEGYSMSGSVPIAFSSLSQLIISKQNNIYYKFNSVKEFDVDSEDKIMLEDTNENIIKLIEEERNKLISMFHNHVSDIINLNNNKTTESITSHENYGEMQMKVFTKNTALIVEPRMLEILPYTINEYYKILGNDWIIVFYCGKGLKLIWESVIGIKDIEIRELEVNNFNSLEYSYFLKQPNLWKSLYGEFVLTFQTDSIIKNIEPYTINNYVKLNKSYIGGNMCYGWNEMVRENITTSYRNFNGGLSLRKRLDMIKIIQTFGIEFTENDSKNMVTDAEDVYFTIGCYKLNLPVGDDEFCSHFAVHSIYYDKFFGVHSSAFLQKSQLIEDHSDLKFFVNNFI